MSLKNDATNFLARIKEDHGPRLKTVMDDLALSTDGEPYIRVFPEMLQNVGLVSLYLNSDDDKKNSIAIVLLMYIHMWDEKRLLRRYLFPYIVGGLARSNNAYNVVGASDLLLADYTLVERRFAPNREFFVLPDEGTIELIKRKVAAVVLDQKNEPCSRLNAYTIFCRLFKKNLDDNPEQFNEAFSRSLRNQDIGPFIDLEFVRKYAADLGV